MDAVYEKVGFNKFMERLSNLYASITYIYPIEDKKKEKVVKKTTRRDGIRFYGTSNSKREPFTEQKPILAIVSMNSINYYIVKDKLPNKKYDSFIVKNCKDRELHRHAYEGEAFKFVVKVKLKDYRVSSSTYGFTNIKQAMFESNDYFKMNKVISEDIIELHNHHNGVNYKFDIRDLEFVYPNIEALLKHHKPKLDKRVRLGEFATVIKHNNARLPYKTEVEVIDKWNIGTKNYYKVKKDNKIHIIESNSLIKKSYNVKKTDKQEINKVPSYGTKSPSKPSNPEDDIVYSWSTLGNTAWVTNP